MNDIDENEFITGWRETARSIPKPAAILCISAHWETRGTFVTAIFAILVNKTVDLDDRKWEADYSYPDNKPYEVTVIIKNE